jgi:hypothetical protein
MGKRWTRNSNLNILNKLDFSIEINDIITKCGSSLTSANGNPIYEGEDIVFSVDNLFQSNKVSIDEDLTFYYDFGVEQKQSSTSTMIYSFNHAGRYPITVAVGDTLGTLSREQVFLEIKNKDPKANFTTTNDKYSIGEEIKFSGDQCNDTKNDIENLRYLWNWGDNTGSFGKYTSYKYSSPGIYNVTLVVKDDDSSTDSYSKLIEIINNEAYISFGNENETSIIEMNEGETYIFHPTISDDLTDLLKSSYYWNSDQNEEPHQGGRIMPYTFQDNDITTIDLEMVDPYGESKGSSQKVQIKNVAPTVNIFNLGVSSNISLQVHRNSSVIENSFRGYLCENERALDHNYFSYINNTEDLINIVYSEQFFSLGRNYSLYLESDKVILSNESYVFDLKMIYNNGYERLFENCFTLSNITSAVSLPLNDYLFNVTLNSDHYPLKAKGLIYDPSADDLSMKVNHIQRELVELNGTSFEKKSYLITLNGITYECKIFEVNSSFYLAVNGTSNVEAYSFINNSFPASVNVDLDIFDIINMQKICETLKIDPSLIKGTISVDHDLFINVEDDDGGIDSQNIHISLEEYSGITIENFSPTIKIDGLRDIHIGFCVKYDILIDDLMGRQFDLISQMDINLVDLTTTNETNFGNNYTFSHSFSHPGIYLLEVTVKGNGFKNTTIGIPINVTARDVFAIIEYYKKEIFDC